MRLGKPGILHKGKKCISTLSLTTMLASLVWFTGCDSSNGTTEQNVQLPEDANIYVLRSTTESQEYVGASGGLALGAVTPNGVVLKQIYNEVSSPSIIGQTIRSIAEGDGIIAIGTNKGLSLCSVKPDKTLVGCNNYSETSTPKLEHQTVNAVEIVDDKLIIANYHGGVLIGDIDIQNYSIKSFVPYNTKSSQDMKRSPVISIALSKDGNKILFGTKGAGIGIADFNKNTQSLSGITYTVVKNGKYNTTIVKDIAVADNDIIALATYSGILTGTIADDNTLNVLHKYNRQTVPGLESIQYTSIAFNKDMSKLAAGTNNYGVLLTDSTTEGELSNFKFYKTDSTSVPSEDIMTVDFSDDGKTVLLGGKASAVGNLEL